MPEKFVVDEMRTIVLCKHCGRKEYYGELRWLNGTCSCRSCYKAQWQDTNHQWYRWDDLDYKEAELIELERSNTHGTTDVRSQTSKDSGI